MFRFQLCKDKTPPLRFQELPGGRTVQKKDLRPAEIRPVKIPVPPEKEVGSRFELLYEVLQTSA